MRYGSVCSGIEAASVAWHPLGWEPAFFSEIEAFPSALLAHRYPRVLNHGDMTRFKEWPDDAIDLLVGGTPCQSFSVAGLRAGLADPRGNLLLTYLAIAARYRPRWLVWENVPGVLSSGDGRDFGALLGGLGQLGYGFAYRVLDAQYVRVDGFERAVPQRRRRVFVVGHLGDWRCAAAVLFDSASLRGDSPPRREAWKNVAPTIDASSGRRRGSGMNPNQLTVPPISVTLTARDRKGPLPEADLSTVIVSHALRADGFDASEDGTGRGTPLVPVAFGSKDHGADAQEQVRPTLRAGGFDGSHANAGVPPAVAFDMRGREGGAQFEGQHATANIRAASGGSSKSYVAEHWAVRRLTPTECERLQGFPDGYTQIPRGNKPTADGPRYKALGNSMAVNCMRWIGERIAMVDATR